MASSLNTPKTNPLLTLSSAIKLSFHVGMGGWVWLKGPRVVSVAPCHNFQCEENKAICEVATGPECTFATGVCCVSPRAAVSECVCLPEPHWWLAGGSWWHLGCHWAAWLVSYVITKAWLPTYTIKNVVKYTEAFSILSPILMLHKTFKQAHREKMFLFKVFEKRQQ